MPAGDYAYLTVADSGRGIPSEELRNVFEPFFSTREVGEGIGLGLSVVWGILQRHEGYIDIHSAPGEGTEFICYFPLCRSTSGASNDGNRSTVAEEAVPGRVLVCEDDAMVRGFTVDLSRNAWIRSGRRLERARVDRVSRRKSPAIFADLHRYCHASNERPGRDPDRSRPPWRSRPTGPLRNRPRRLRYQDAHLRSR